MHIKDERTGRFLELEDSKNIDSETMETKTILKAVKKIGEAAELASISVKQLAELLFEFGEKPTNNWKKMHGKVMLRRRAYRKLKR